MKITRRTFLKAAGAGTATVAVAKLRSPIFQPQTDGAAPSQHDERWVPTVCLQCPGGCGILVRVVDGRAIKVEGNPLHPINKGKVCPKANAGLQVLYDPDRIKGPMRQVGQRGSGQWEPITWEEAIQTVAHELRALRDAGQPHSLVFLTGRVQGQMEGLIERFCRAYGTPNLVNHGSMSVEGTRIANYLVQGHHAESAYDWDNTMYVLSFGRAFLEASRPTVRQLRAFGYMRRDRPNKRAKFIQIEPRLSITAAKADEWIPIKPGTDGALALGIAHVIVAEELWDQDFVGKYTHGFDDWTDEAGVSHMGFRTLVLRDYSPRQVEAITGVPAETIVRIAQEFATTRPCIAAGGRGISMQSNGLFNWMAIQALNALVGSFEVPGGVMTQREPPFMPWPEVITDAVAEQGLAMPRVDHAGTRRYPLARNVYQQVPDSILAEDPYPVKALLLYYTNPLFSTPQVSRFYEAIQKVPFVVSFSPFLDDSSVHADLILPDHTYLERWQDDVVDPSLGYPVVSLRQPAVEPLHNTMNTGDVLLRIARRVGGGMAESFPWTTFQEVLHYRIGGLWQAERGSIRATTFTHFWDEFSTKGVWHDPPYLFGQWGRVFNTPSGRFEFYSQHLQRTLEGLAQQEAAHKGTSAAEELEAMLADLEVGARGDELYLPHYEPPLYIGDEAEYPFHLNTFKVMAHAEGRGANSPWLAEKFGLHVNMKWDSWLEINPQAAEVLGIHDGDWVWVESPLGERFKVRVKLYPGARPDTVNMPFEFGHRAYGRWAQGRGVNPNWLIINAYNRLGGTAAWFSTRVKVYKGY
ncbi:MAG: molybdopterin-dependent oxidoreductase [Anaerolineae bacterium]